MSQAVSRLSTAVCLAAAIASTAPSLANDAPERSVMVLVGDMDQFNIGQDGYCGKRTEIDRPGNARFRIPSQVETFFFARTTFRVEHGTYYCESDHSFTPEPAALHIVRYSFEGNQCKLELFRTLPGGTPQSIPVKVEQRRSCLRP